VRNDHCGTGGGADRKPRLILPLTALLPAAVAAAADFIAAILRAAHSFLAGGIMPSLRKA